MSEYNQKIYELSKKYNLPESSIDESLIPVMVAVDVAVNEMKSMNEKVKASITTHQHQHYYDKGKPLDIFLGRWGWGVWAFMAMLIVAFLLMFFSENRRKLEKLESVMQYNDSTQTYFIDNRFYEVVNTKQQKGVILKP